jgi:hypothetical protein
VRFASPPLHLLHVALCGLGLLGGGHGPRVPHERESQVVWTAVPRISVLGLAGACACDEYPPLLSLAARTQPLQAARSGQQ